MSKLTTARQLIYTLKRNELSGEHVRRLANIESCLRAGIVSDRDIKALQEMRAVKSKPLNPSRIFIDEAAPVSKKDFNALKPTVDDGEIPMIPRARGRLSAEARRAYARAKEEQATSTAMKDPKYVSMAHLEMERARARTRELLRGKNR